MNAPVVVLREARRRVLKGLAGAGLAVSYFPARAGGPDAVSRADGAGQGAVATATSADPANRVVVPALVTLLGGSALDPAFLNGVRQVAAGLDLGAPVAHRLDGLDLAVLLRLEALFHDGRETRLVGLLDDASAMLVTDLVRSAGGRVLAVSHHRTGDDAPALQWAAATGRALARGQAATVAPAVSGDRAARAHVSLCCLI